MWAEDRAVGTVTGSDRPSSDGAVATDGASPRWSTEITAIYRRHRAPPRSQHERVAMTDAADRAPTRRRESESVRPPSIRPSGTGPSNITHATVAPTASQPGLRLVSATSAMDVRAPAPLRAPALLVIQAAATPAMVPRPIVTGDRAMNVGLAALGLVLTSPLSLLIAVAIKLTSRGPVLYVQERVGLDRRETTSHDVDPRRSSDLGGKPFTMYKFRSMCVDAELESGAVWACQGDPRVTPVGRFLRRYRLDELPQLLNVLRGDMNIVGPRPERPTIFADLRQQLPEYPLRQRARPGITGLAQINHHYDRSLDDVRIKLGYDLAYIRQHSAVEDLRIMIRTVPAVILGPGGW